MTTLLVFSSACTHAATKEVKAEKGSNWIQPDSTVKAILGNHLTSVLFSPSKVCCYFHKGVEKVSHDDFSIEEGYVRDTLLSRLSIEQIAFLQYALLRAERNYSLDSIPIRSPYMPVLEFRFVKKKEEAYVMVSPIDFTWTLYYDGKQQMHWNYADKQLLSEFFEYFLSKKK